tara:strand:+ start:2544 stop:3155 length:612 start_codon:yes stop_codon:yes gene_type:complete
MRFQQKIAQILICIGLLACSSVPPPPPAELVELKTEEKIEAISLSPGDIFEIRVFREKDLSGTFRVGPDGSIRFPLIGHMIVTGLTPEKLSDQIRTKLVQGSFLKDPHVSVLISEYRSKKIFVIGKVAKPGTFPYEQGMNIVQAITLAGGFAPLASGNQTILTRLREGKEQRIRVPVHQISRGKHPNVLLKPGDIIYVPESIL